jgi:cell division protein FtsA
VTSARNICRAIQRAGLKVYDLTLEPLASAAAVLDPDEKDLGVVLLDSGGGTTDVAVFHEGAVRHTAIIPFGGCNVTSDIASGCERRSTRRRRSRSSTAPRSRRS